jgi:hypothetical protein
MRHGSNPARFHKCHRLTHSKWIQKLHRLVPLVAVFLLPLSANGTTIDIKGPLDSISPFGSFAMISGNSGASSPGSVLDVLQLQKNGSESNTNSISMGSLRTVLSAGGISSTTYLALGFGVNETGPAVVVTDLVITFERPGGGVDQFSLGADDLRVFNYHQGQSTAEARFIISLGFDFMAEYGNSSSELFGIEATIDNTSDGFEIFFLSSAFTQEASSAVVPEPATFSLFALGIVLLTCSRRL